VPVVQLHLVAPYLEQSAVVDEVARDGGFGEVCGRFRGLHRKNGATYQFRWYLPQQKLVRGTIFSYIEAVIARVQRSISGEGRMPSTSVTIAMSDSTQRASARGSMVISPAGASMYMTLTMRR
jgi:hypothetical protein